jgi:glutaminyl-peptide cyclotransferase
LRTLRALSFLVLTVLVACGPSKKEETKTEPIKLNPAPVANADSAFFFVEKQVKFGPRVPNSNPHKKTGDYLVATLKRYGAKVTEQNFESMSYDGKKLFLRNIIGSFYPEKQKRILLAAHWDTRPFADKDKGNPDAPFDGANDGASGVGVLLEVARLLNSGAAPNAGIDIIFFDGEDWGEKVGESQPSLPTGQTSWWLLGSQYWASHKHASNYTAYYGILLDMVGAKNSRFFKERSSLDYAPSVVDKVWNTAAQLGRSNLFVSQTQGAVIDDHVPVNEKARIPMIDIINYDPVNGDFGDFHHTTKDNLTVIDKEVLSAVAQVVVQVVYNEP